MLRVQSCHSSGKLEACHRGYEAEQEGWVHYGDDIEEYIMKIEGRWEGHIDNLTAEKDKAINGRIADDHT